MVSALYQGGSATTTPLDAGWMWSRRTSQQANVIPSARERWWFGFRSWRVTDLEFFPRFDFAAPSDGVPSSATSACGCASSRMVCQIRPRVVSPVKRQSKSSGWGMTSWRFGAALCYSHDRKFHDKECLYCATFL